MTIKRFDDVLNVDLTGTITILYGNTMDEFITPDLTILTLDKVLDQYLRAKGFDLVVFFDAAWQLHCYDLDTYYLFKQKARGSVDEAASGSTPASLINRQDDQRPLGAFSLMRSSGLNQASAEEKVEIPTPTRSVQGYYSLVERELNALEALDGLFYNQDLRSAIVISQFEDSFVTSSAQPQFFNRISRWAKETTLNHNRCFIVLSAQNENELPQSQDRREAAFLRNLIESNKQQEDRGNLIYIEPPSDDEIKRLIHRFRLLKKLDVQWDKFEQMVRWVAKERKMLGFWTKHFSTDELEQFSVAAIRKIIKESTFVPNELSARERLDDLIGLEKPKNQIFNHIEKLKMAQDGLMGKITFLPHMVFRGNPGTGKTTVARLVGEILEEEGILPRGHLVETNRSGLVAGYQGQTAIKTQAVVDRARNGVLFIDEAYALIKDQQDSFGQEAVDTLVPAMTNYARSTVFIFAGYKTSMNQFLDQGNEGLKGRIELFVDFEDYHPEEMVEIFQKILKGSLKVFSPKLLEAALSVFKVVYLNRGDDFANARQVEKISAEVIQNHLIRCRRENLDFTQSPILNQDFPERFNEDIVKGKNDQILSPYDRLMDLVGLKNVKERVKDIIAAIQLQQRTNQSRRGMRLHMVFTGNPGTGKTTVARLIGNIFKEHGVLSSGHLVEATREDIIGTYQGQTAPKVKRLVDKAENGILFIDEAYAIARDEGDTYGQEAIDTLVPLIENYRDRLVVIIAGYPADMEEFLSKNKGLKERFTAPIHFEDYSPTELYTILNWNIRKKFLPIHEDVKELCKNILANLFNQRGESFSNARAVENLLQEMYLRYSRRCLQEEASITDIPYIPADIPEHYDTTIPKDGTGDESLEYLLDELDNLVGLNEVKNFIKGLIKEYRFDQIRNTRLQKRALEHIIFKGNPGTGKTTVARLLGKIFRKLELVKAGFVKEVSRADLVAGYSGQTATKTRRTIREARGGVLFIDEAYSLAQAHDGFGREAIDTLIKEIEDYNDEMLVVAAGYPKPMDRFLRTNPGLKSRFPHLLKFEDYSNEELCEIFGRFARKDGYAVPQEVDDKLKEYFESLPRGENFGNARTARNVYQKCLRKLKTRIIKEIDEQNNGKDISFNDSQLVFIPEDVPEKSQIGASNDQNISPIQRVPSGEIFKTTKKKEIASEKEKKINDNFFISGKKPVLFLTTADDQGVSLTELKEELQVIEEIFDPLRGQQKLDIRAVENPKIDNLAHTVRHYKDTICLFHYAGHADQHSLYFSNGATEVKEARMSSLQKFFGVQKNMEVVFLNGCATQGQVNALHDAGIKAVVATSAPVKDSIAKDFAIQFYDGLANNHTLGEAFDSADGVISSSPERSQRIEGYRGLATRSDAQKKSWGLFVNKEIDPHETIKEWKLPLDEAIQEIVVLPNYLISSKNIIGREGLIAQLYHLFEIDGNETIWVHGPGGMGKTELMRQFLSELNKESAFAYSYWVNASSTIKNSLTSDYNLINALGISFSREQDRVDKLRIIADKLNRLKGDKLIVFDNYTLPTNPKHQDFTFLSQSLNSGWKKVVISREPPLSQHGFIGLKVEGLGRLKSIELFQLHYQNSSENSFELMNQLCESIGDKPLLLELYGTLGKIQGLTLEKLLPLVKGETSSSGPSPDREVAYTIPAEDKNEIHGFITNALPLLDPTEEEIIKTWILFPDRVFTIDELYELYDKRTPSEQNDLIDHLKSSLVEKGWINQQEESFELHPLIRENLSSSFPFQLEDFQDYIDVLTALLTVDPFRPYKIINAQQAVWMSCAAELISRHKEQLLRVLKGQILLEAYSKNLFIAGEIEESRSLQNEILRRYEHVDFKEEDSQHETKLVLGLARYYNLKADYQKANEHLNKASELSGATNKQLYLELLDLRTNNLKLNGDNIEAKNNAKTAEPIAKEVLGVTNPGYFKFAADLAYLLNIIDNFKDALELLESFVEFYEEIEDNSPDKAYYLQILGNIYLENGEEEEAEEAFEEALDILQETLGSVHPKTLLAKNHLARALAEQGQINLAENLILDGLNYCEKIYGTKHPIVYLSQAYLGEIYRMNRKYALALEYAQKAKANAEYLVSAGSIASDHPDLVIINANLAVIQMELGEWKESSQSFAATIEPMKRKFGPTNPKVLEYQIQVADTQADIGDLKGAQISYQEALVLSTNRFPEEDKQNLFLRRQLGLIQILTGNSEEGLRNLKKSVELSRKNNELDELTQLSFDYFLSLGNKLRGNFNEARKTLHELDQKIKEYEKSNDSRLPEIRCRITIELSELLILQGDLEQAHENLDFVLAILQHQDKTDPDIRELMCSTFMMKAQAFMQTKREEAARFVKLAYEMAQQLYPANSSAMFEYRLALTLFNDNEDKDRMVDELRELSKDAEKFYGHDSLITLITKGVLVRIHNSFEEYEEASRLLHSIIRPLEKLMEGNHPFLAYMYQAQYTVSFYHDKNHARAIAQAEQTIDVFQKVFGEEHHDTLQAKRDLDNIRDSDL